MGIETHACAHNHHYIALHVTAFPFSSVLGATGKMRICGHADLRIEQRVTCGSADMRICGLNAVSDHLVASLCFCIIS